MFQKCKTTQFYLHGASLVIAYQRGPPLNGDGFWQRHGAVRLIPGQVLQAAGVRLFLPVLGENMRREKEKCVLLSIRTKHTTDGATVVLPAELPLQKLAWTQSQSEHSPPPPHLWHPGWSEAPRGSVPLTRGPVRRCNKVFPEGKQTVVDKSFKITITVLFVQMLDDTVHHHIL